MRSKPRHAVSLAWPLLALVSLVGCNRDDIQVYRVSKEQSVPASQGGMMPPNHPSTSSASSVLPQLKWTLPAGWEEAPPGEMRVASFRVQQAGKQAELGVVPLPGLTGRELESVNRWRSTVGLPAVTEADLPKLAEKVEIAGQQGDLYDQAGENPGSGDKTRILAAILQYQGVAWYFKFTGDEEIVTQQKPAFLSLLKSLVFTGEASAPVATSAQMPPTHPPVGDGSSMMQAASGAPGSSQAKPVWEVPSGWKEAPAGQFLVAKYTVAGTGNTQAAVNVSMSAGTGGGLVGNINRWRGQLGLAELPEAEINKLVTSLDTAAGKATLVEMSGTDPRSGQKARLVGAMVPREGSTWFYKLMGDEQLVESQKSAFTTFVRTAKYN